MVIALLVLSGGRAWAQGVGLRAGVSGSPDQFYAGVHYETAELTERLRFRPNLEVGVGDDTTLVALNVEFAYRIPIRRHPWSVYFGGGPALDLYHSEGETTAEGGFNILVGLLHDGGLFVELKVGALDSPSVKVGVGYSFK
jgi:hypothetical protein